MKTGNLSARLARTLFGAIILILSSYTPAREINSGTAVSAIAPTAGTPVTPSPIPTYSLELTQDNLPATLPVSGFVEIEMPQTINWDDAIIVTIITIPGADCQIWYYGTSGLSHAERLEWRKADANRILLMDMATSHCTRPGSRIAALASPKKHQHW